jgi:hypothetical protein
MAFSARTFRHDVGRTLISGGVEGDQNLDGYAGDVDNGLTATVKPEIAKAPWAMTAMRAIKAAMRAERVWVWRPG